MARGKYWGGVDAVRFLSAIIVVVFHLGWLAQVMPTSGTADLIASGAYSFPAAIPAGAFGWVGVEIFFVISGMVIANSAFRASPIAFAKSRVYRLYPAAWICTTINLIIILAVGYVGATLAQRLIWYADSMLLLPGRPSISPVYWTLGVEIIFYALVFAWKVIRPQASLLSVGLVLFVWSAAYLIAHRLGYVALPQVIEQVSLLRHGVFFAAGILLWIYSERPLTVLESVVLVAALGLGTLEVTMTANANGTGSAVPAAIAFLVAIGLLFASVSKIGGMESLGPRGRAVLRAIGLMTYPIYLLHYDLGAVWIRIMMRLGVPSPLAFATAILAVCGVAYLVIALLEPTVRSRLKNLVEAIESRWVFGKPRFSRLYGAPAPATPASQP